MIIRSARFKNIDQISIVRDPKSHGKRHEYGKIATERIANMETGVSVFLVAEDKSIVGHVQLLFSDGQHDCPWMVDLYVNKQSRHMGIGTALVKACEKLVKEKSFVKIGVSVNPTLNLHAKEWYEKLGYSGTGKQTYLDGVYDGTEDWVMDMEKVLK